MDVFFYSSVRTKKMFSIQSYYRNDICILRDLGSNVHLSNSIWAFLCFWKYDIAFLYFYRYSFFAALFAKLFRKKVYYTGGIDYLEKTFATVKQRLLQIIFFKLCNFLSDRNIIVSSTDWENVREIYCGKIPNKCSLSFHSIDYSKFEYTENFSSKKKIISTIAWMVNLDNVFRKGVDKSILVFSDFIKVFPEYRLVIAGPAGIGSEYILKMIKQFGLENVVIYKGAISEDEKIELLKDSRCYLQLSKYEGFGIAAIEALAAGNQVIHSGNGGLKDALGVYGYKVDIENKEQVLNTLLNICEHDIDVEFTKKGIKYVADNFSYNKRLSDFRKIIGEYHAKS